MLQIFITLLLCSTYFPIALSPFFLSNLNSDDFLALHFLLCLQFNLYLFFFRFSFKIFMLSVYFFPVYLSPV
jgi:hypothetical protein